MKKHLLTSALSCAAILLPLARTVAADGTWNVTSGGAWTNPTYWTPNTGSAPGSTNSTTSTDVATFGDSITAGRTITVDTSRNIFGIVFTNTAYAYTLSSGSLLFSSGGYVNFTGSGTGITNTISSAITNLGSGANFSNNSTSGALIVSGNVTGPASFINNSTSGLMNVTGAVAGTAAAGEVTTLTIGGNNTSITNQLGSGQLTDGANGGKLALVKTGDSIWYLSRNATPQNAHSGGTDVQQGTLILQIGAGVGTGTLTLGGLSGSGNALLDMSGAQVGTISNNIVVRSGSTGTVTVQHTNTGTRTLSGVMTLNRDLTLSATSATGQFTVSGGMVGSGDLIKTGAGSLYLNVGTARGGIGDILINEGTALMANSLSMSENMRLSVASGTTFTYTSAGANVAGLDGAGTVIANVSGTTLRSFRLGGTGNYSFSGVLTNINTGPLGLMVDLKEGGSQVFSGAIYNNGDARLRSGTLALDYSSSSASKLSDTNILYINGGTLDLRGGSGTETVASTTVAGGAQANIMRSSGSTVLALGALSTGSGGALNIAADNIATTTSANTNGIIGGSGRITIAGADWAANDGSGNIVAYTGYTAYTDNSAGANTINYLVTGNAGSTVNVSAQTLKITTTGAGQSLNLGTRSLTLGNGSGQSAGLLFVGADDYTITAGLIGASGGGNAQAIHNYGAGKLTLGAGLNHPTSFFGTGYTVLASNSTQNAGISVGGGTVEFSSNAQIGSPTGTGGVSIWGGRLVANTAGGDISLTNGAGGSTWRQVQIGGDNPVLDVIGGNSLIVGGVVTYADNVGGANPLTIGSASSSGKIVFSGNNANWNGDLNLAGATLSVSADNNLGNANNWLEFTGTGILETTATFGMNRFVVTRSGKTGTFAPAVGTVLTLTNYIQGAGGIKVDGAGTVELLGAANSYTGKTTIENGTLKLGAGASIASSSEVNLGTTNAPGTLDLSANSSYAFGWSQTVSGAGTISIGSGKTVTVAGILAPGNSTGKIIVGGNLSMAGTSEIKMELAGTGGVAGTDFDQIDVSGFTLTADGTLTITGWSGYDVTQTATYDLFDFSTFSGNFDGVMVGTEMLSFDSGSNAWAATNGLTTYNFGLSDGVLAVTTVPEPSTCALLGLGGLALAAYRLRRRNR